MESIEINGVTLTPLQKIPGQLGEVLHGLKATEESYAGFGEAYFSTIGSGMIKGWKKHLAMTLNLIVPVGEICFFLFDDRKDSPTRDKLITVNLSVQKNYQRLTVPSGIWMAFKGMSSGLNLLLNVASIPHDPGEVKTLPLDNHITPDLDH